MTALNIVFAGTPEAAIPSLLALHDKYRVITAITRSPAPTGRKRILTPSPVAVLAAELNIPLIESNRLDPYISEKIAALQPDLGVVVAYGAIVKPELLAIPKYGWINLHFSLLPRWRGAAPVQRSLIANDQTIGVTVFQLDHGLDTGDIHDSRKLVTPAAVTAGKLLQQLAEIGADTLLESVTRISLGQSAPRPQQGEITFAPKLVLDEGRLDWQQSAVTILARYRGVTPEPGAWTIVGTKRIKVLAIRAMNESIPEGYESDRLPPGEVVLSNGCVIVGTGNGLLKLLTLQSEGRTQMSAVDWLRGVPGARAVFG